MKGKKIRRLHENFNRKEVKFKYTRYTNNIGHQKTGSWVKGHSLGYSIKIKKNSRKKLKKTFHTPFYVGI
jgi:hypothetical protein